MSVTAHPAATVVLLRDGPQGPEVLLVRRSKKLAFHGGAWVFPGGRIDAADYAAVCGDDVMTAARHAAAREAREEAGVAVDPRELAPISRWITPEALPKRFDTWFFAAPARAAEVRVDGVEIREHAWMEPHQAVARHQAGDIVLAPPTFVTLTMLAGHPDVARLLTALASHPFETYTPRLRPFPGGACSLYPGDVAYEGGDLDRPGPRNRLLFLASGWRYERSRPPSPA